ncbi:hypothetical protein [Serratia odorifera]|jgi:hypothetical protein|uniref:DUF4761 domain-containing protein n=1 Tax=Serratia odorifera TaxID=618 RepID=A0A447KP55_SEROD|nr:hypothetical protein [Serratia odorifera]PNK91646.1 hypothetical protein CEQ31_019175 [Serratia odorifera]RII72769.1 hypothetical protein DX901_07265 [Serratia odorifera]VDZ54981.1 Uncharacterised protein [Serratia odorifera]
MKKRYSKHGSHAGSIPGLVPVGKNVYVYSGFTIRKSSRNYFNSSNAYLINKRDDSGAIDNYYGRDFALAEAMRTIDKLNNGDNNGS